MSGRQRDLNPPQSPFKKGGDKNTKSPFLKGGD